MCGVFATLPRRQWSQMRACQAGMRTGISPDRRKNVTNGRRTSHERKASVMAGFVSKDIHTDIMVLHENMFNKEPTVAIQVRWLEEGLYR